MNGMIEKAIEKVLLGDASHNDASDFGAQHKIVVCQRGFVYAGDIKRVGQYIVIENAVNVRKWGTTKGLGELATKGNQPNTEADACGTVRVHELTTVSLMDCKERINATA